MRRALGAARSLLALLSVLMLFAGCAVYQRLVLAPVGWLRPEGQRERVGAYMRWVSRRVFDLVRLGGARFRRSGSFRSDRPALVLMNHQSLLDIPTAILMCGPPAPRFVTRRRYARGVPFVASLLRLSEAPIVDPQRAPRKAVAMLERTADTLESALLIFPEGARSRDGSLGRFHTAGLRAILRRRRMPVYLIVTDGFWRCRALADFLLHVDRIDGRTELLGPFEPPGEEEELGRFLEQARERIGRRLEEMRVRAGDG